MQQIYRKSTKKADPNGLALIHLLPTKLRIRYLSLPAKFTHPAQDCFCWENVQTAASTLKHTIYQQEIFYL
ncbi:MAG: hypothetical protein BGO70_15660 [Bacteroidetes bacterium 43-93]|nr:MAG: hypothetical protein BGO70_15660 [Bacteroidetes bacterium 43-93]